MEGIVASRKLLVRTGVGARDPTLGDELSRPGQKLRHDVAGSGCLADLRLGGGGRSSAAARSLASSGVSSAGVPSCIRSSSDLRSISGLKHQSPVIFATSHRLMPSQQFRCQRHCWHASAEFCQGSHYYETVFEGHERVLGHQELGTQGARHDQQNVGPRNCAGNFPEGPALTRKSAPSQAWKANGGIVTPKRQVQRPAGTAATESCRNRST